MFQKNTTWYEAIIKKLRLMCVMIKFRNAHKGSKKTKKSALVSANIITFAIQKVN